MANNVLSYYFCRHNYNKILRKNVDYTLESEDYNNNQYDDETTDVLYNRLKELDKDIEIDKNNRRRISTIHTIHEVGNGCLIRSNRG